MSSSSTTDRVDRILDTNEATFDLREPISRDDAGIADDRDTVFIAHTGDTPLIATHLDLPGGKTFDLEVSSLMFDAAKSEDGAPHDLTVSRKFDTLDEAYAHLQEATPEWDLDASDVEKWYADAKANLTQGSFATYSTTVFPAPAIGYLSLEVEAALLAPSERVGVNYYFRWQP